MGRDQFLGFYLISIYFIARDGWIEEDMFGGNRNTHYDAHLGSAEMLMARGGSAGVGVCWWRWWLWWWWCWGTVLVGTVGAGYWVLGGCYG